ncbi:DeoR family transcriptional regulator [Aneurinibacillus soli]|uniref:Transcription factor FapR n=1 Tax=Aneurinibacillus soli TaxID=1500254 RepID=A0A0U5BBI6_9BACL|nr:transcription factor FapR [Aneurinibacillus soli]PYE63508.1 DeoR family transcriptional regulator [Aneurinibacillus soli]BAU27559.1 Transcription factor FapR [Aneurinibacillus soli]
MARLSKKSRQEALHMLLAESPFYTDEELAEHFRVSIQTIRLDRLELGIPEVRERIKNVAQQNHGEVKSLPIEEVVGELVDLQLDHSAISLLDITEEHIFSRTHVARGHHIFAQANSLAVAVIDAAVVLTAAARIRYVRPVRLGERLVAKAVVRETQGEQSKVRVETRVQDELVFSGTFRVYRMPDFDAHASGKQEDI